EGQEGQGWNDRSCKQGEAWHESIMPAFPRPPERSLPWLFFSVSPSPVFGRGGWGERGLKLPIVPVVLHERIDPLRFRRIPGAGTLMQADMQVAGAQRTVLPRRNRLAALAAGIADAGQAGTLQEPAAQEIPDARLLHPGPLCHDLNR